MNKYLTEVVKELKKSMAFVQEDLHDAIVEFPKYSGKQAEQLETEIAEMGFELVKYREVIDHLERHTVTLSHAKHWLKQQEESEVKGVALAWIREIEVWDDEWEEEQEAAQEFLREVFEVRQKALKEQRFELAREIESFLVRLNKFCDTRPEMFEFIGLFNDEAARRILKAVR